MVSLISLVQALRYETIPASLHCEQENDYINWKESPFYVNKVKKSWREGEPKLGAVSAFGMSGTNVHMVVENYQDEAGIPKEAPCYLLAFSAKTQASLEEKIKDMIEFLETGNKCDLTGISYTLLEGRQHFNYRYAAIVQDREHAVYVLKQIGNQEKIPNLFQGKVPRDFTGLKAIEQYAWELLKQTPALETNPSKYQENLSALAELYCQGYQLDWQQLFTGSILNGFICRLIPLPGKNTGCQGKGTQCREG